ncbi:hypothetical protein DK2_000016 [Bacillus phage DK2]|uniref:Uncharacterized protein n=1 Tax=Bacillus phage DK2 TaxID=2500809 RepID=A0A3T0IJ28_9CAUD|nr:hypothetical protein H3017_gp16 [Bacillus phage DK2]AZU99769.1 hypothetical protein DK2_000016 [Bacillus phage DK2]
MRKEEKGCFHEWKKYDEKNMKDGSQCWLWFCVHCDGERVTKVWKKEVER